MDHPQVKVTTIILYCIVNNYLLSPLLYHFTTIIVWIEDDYYYERTI